MCPLLDAVPLLPDLDNRFLESLTFSQICVMIFPLSVSFLPMAKSPFLHFLTNISLARLLSIANSEYPKHGADFDISPFVKEMFELTGLEFPGVTTNIEYIHLLQQQPTSLPVSLQLSLTASYSAPFMDSIFFQNNFSAELWHAHRWNLHIKHPESF